MLAEGAEFIDPELRMLADAGGIPPERFVPAGTVGAPAPAVAVAVIV
jgi:hypothetical protein